MASTSRFPVAATGQGRFQQHSDYTIACFCPMGVELAPIEALFDTTHAPLPTRREHNNYSLGSIGPHNIVVAVLPEIGNNSAAIAATQLINDFPSVRYGFVVGIGGGLPTQAVDIRLGDVVVSQAKDVTASVIQYDRGKLLSDGLFQRATTYNKPPAILASSIERLKALHKREGSRILQLYTSMISRWFHMSYCYRHPGTEADKLFEAAYLHQPGPDCSTCDASRIVSRPQRQTPAPVVHYGPVGSANVVLKDASSRHMLSKSLDVLCVEMEAAGVLDVLPCIVIRGICDYADSHKTKEWQPYAAAVAAAYFKELLQMIPPRIESDAMFTDQWRFSAPPYYNHPAHVYQHDPYSTSNPNMQGAASIYPASQMDHRKQSSCGIEHQMHALNLFYPSTRQASHADIRFRDSIPSPRIVSPTGDANGELSDEQICQSLINSLKFDSMDSRHATIRHALDTTCEWFLHHEEYKHWIHHARILKHHGLLWVKGKPAAGKSTLFKHILAHAEKERLTDLAVSFFFHARGGELEKSVQGMYRSLIIQLITKVPALRSAFIQAGIRQVPQSWEIDLLQNLFASCITSLGDKSLVCFIDALDECDEEAIRDMVAFLEEIAQAAISRNTRLLMCFSSRHCPKITVKKGLEVILEDQEGHKQDLIIYLDSKLRGDDSPTMVQIKREILKRASGVFLWVVLVVKILNKEHDTGRMHNLQKKLTQIPDGLQELFQDILTRDNTNLEELALCLQWILHAQKPLTCEELYCGILSEIDPHALNIRKSGSTLSHDATVRFILDASKGLAETTKGWMEPVQFIHESVREFLLQSDGLKGFRSDLAESFARNAHLRLRNCCQVYWDMTSEAIDSEIRKPAKSVYVFGIMSNNRYNMMKDFPFIGYAINNILYHADQADKEGHDQATFVSHFPFNRWSTTFEHINQGKSSEAPSWSNFLEVLIHRRHLCLGRKLKLDEFGILPYDLRRCLMSALRRKDKLTVEMILYRSVCQEINRPKRYSLTDQALNLVTDSLLLIPMEKLGHVKRSDFLLNLALERDDVDMLKSFLSTDIVYSEGIFGGDHYLLAAAKGGRRTVFNFIFSYFESDLSLVARSNILYSTAKRGWVEELRKIVAGYEALLHFEDPARSPDPTTPFLCAVATGQSSFVFKILSVPGAIRPKHEHIVKAFELAQKNNDLAMTLSLGGYFGNYPRDGSR